MKDKDFSNMVRKSLEWELNSIVSAWYSQNINKNIKDKYLHTKKSFFSKFTQNNINKKNTSSKKKKIYFKKPYFEDIVEFPLDNRMITWQWKNINKMFRKDDNIENLYWFSFLNPFKEKNSNNSKEYKNYKKNINLPIFIYPEIKRYIDLWYKMSFSIHQDYLKINFNIPETDILKLNSNKKKLDKIAIDFWKYISTYDWKQSKQFDLSKMYRNNKDILTN